MTRPFNTFNHQMQSKTLLVLLAIAAVLMALYMVIRPNGDPVAPEHSTHTQNSDRSRDSPSPADDDNRETNFDRRPSKIIYTKHARCRMGCRHIDETEVKEILERGRINHAKSDPASRPDPTYALEGRTNDGQEVRIVFAAADEGMVVITVIDLQKKWSCNCK